MAPSIPHKLLQCLKSALESSPATAEAAESFLAALAQVALNIIKDSANTLVDVLSVLVKRFNFVDDLVHVLRDPLSLIVHFL